jgi:hypothetical protein
MLEILSKVADEQTKWGLAGRDLLAKITKSYQGLSINEHWIREGSEGGYEGRTTISYTYTAPGSGCTYQPPTGPAVTLAAKQTFVYGPEPTTFNFAEIVMIYVTCLNLNPEPFGEPDMCLQIKTVTETETIS